MKNRVSPLSEYSDKSMIDFIYFFVAHKKGNNWREPHLEESRSS